MPLTQPDPDGGRGLAAVAADADGPLVLGIDPGLSACGWGLVRGGAVPLFRACGAVRPRAADALPARLAHIYDALQALIAEHAPAEVAVEEPFVKSLQPASALAIGQARALAVLAAGRAGLPVAFYAPRQVKLAVSGYGGGDKRQVQAMVRILLGLAADPRPHDAADALAVALCHLAHRRAAALAAPDAR